MIVYLIRQPCQAWQYGSGIPPVWADDCLRMNDAGELLHVRQSGMQVLRLGEWLIKSLEGGVVFYTDAEMWKVFER